MSDLERICNDIIRATNQWTREACPTCDDDVERLDIIKRFDVVQLWDAAIKNDIVKARNMVDWIRYHTPLPDYLVRRFEKVEKTYDETI